MESCSEKMGADGGRKFWVVAGECWEVVSAVADGAGGP